MEDAAAQPLYEPSPGTTPLWQQTCLVGLFDASLELRTVSNQLQQALNAKIYATLRIEPLEEQHWERVWMNQFHPMRSLVNVYGFVLAGRPPLTLQPLILC